MKDNEEEKPVLTARQCEAIAETTTLARILAKNYAELVGFYISEFKKTLPEAVAEANKTPREYVDRVLRKSPEQVTWLDLGGLQSVDPALGLARWEEIKDAARDEIASGMFGADQFNDDPYGRAQFLAVRSAFGEQWQPANDGERLLIDMLAQLFWNYLFWLGVLQSRAHWEVFRERDNGDAYRTGSVKPTTLSAAESQEQAAAMADRFNRLFLRTLRGLRDLRRYSASIMIHNTGQVNIGGQQINTTKLEADTGEEEE